jgi:DNA-binding CsgD family transcriptional regulator
MTHRPAMIETGVRSAPVARSVGAAAGTVLLARNVGAAAGAVLLARGDSRELRRISEHSHVPMVMVDTRRRYVEANLPARLASRLSLDELRTLAIDDLTPPDRIEDLKQGWARLLQAWCLAGHYRAGGLDGSGVEFVYCAVAHVLRGRHLIAFAPAHRPEDELVAIDRDGPRTRAGLTAREIEVLALAAQGLSGPDLAEALTLSRTTVNTHFKNIHAKLQVQTRAAAVAKAMRLGVID